MKIVTVSELKFKATQIVSEIIKKREGVIVTKNGKPVVYMKPISEKEIYVMEDEKGGEKVGKRRKK